MLEIFHLIVLKVSKGIIPAGFIYDNLQMFQYQGSKIEVFSVQPGMISTSMNRRNLNANLHGIYHYIIAVLFKTAAEGAQTTIYCATEAKQHPEMYFT